MLSHSADKAVHRIIDANINRTKEGLRVCEEISRFLLNSRSLTAGFKKIRHELDAIIEQLGASQLDLLKERKSLLDVGRKIYVNELKRRNLHDIAYANMQRAKESIRVLEEFSKLISQKTAVRFKELRYEIYRLEKKTCQKMAGLLR